MLSGVTVGLVTVGINHLSLRHWHRWQTEHWSERARLFHPVRGTATFNLFLGAANAGLLGYWLARESPLGVGLFSVVGFAAALAGNYGVDRKVAPQMDWWSYCGGAARNWGLIFLLGSLFVGTGWAIRGEERWPHLGLVLVAFLAVYLPLITVGWTPLLRWVGLIRAVPPELNEWVRQVATDSGVEVRRVGMLISSLAMAVALPFRKEILLTPPLVRILSEAELRCVVHHELAHLAESPSILMGRLAGACAYVPLIFLGPVIRNYPTVGFPAVMLSVAVLSLASTALARRMEVRADRAPAASEADGMVSAQALERLYEANLIPASGIARGQPHPDLYDRMLSAGLQPDFPRPKAPHVVNAAFLIWIGLAVMQSVPVAVAWLRR